MAVGGSGGDGDAAAAEGVALKGVMPTLMAAPAVARVDRATAARVPAEGGGDGVEAEEEAESPSASAYSTVNACELTGDCMIDAAGEAPDAEETPDDAPDDDDDEEAEDARTPARVGPEEAADAIEWPLLSEEARGGKRERADDASAEEAATSFATTATGVGTGA